MNYPPILFHPINSITAYKGQIIYDTPETEAKAQTPVPYLQWQPAPGVTPHHAQPGRHAERPDPAAARPVGQISPAGPAPAAPPMGAGPLPGPPPAGSANAPPLPAEGAGG